MTPRSHLDISVRRELRILCQSLELVDTLWSAGDSELHELHEVVQQAVDGFKSRTMVASWQEH